MDGAVIADIGAKAMWPYSNGEMNPTVSRRLIDPLDLEACGKIFCEDRNFLGERSEGGNRIMSLEKTNGGQKYPLDDLVYDLMMIITKKSKALEAMNKYIQDAQKNNRVKESLEKIRRQDQESVEELTRHLSYLIGQQNVSGQPSGQSATGSSAKR